MKAFREMPEDRRRLICEQTAARTGLFEASVEKDFWVCWILEKLFTLSEWGEAITFKGGTSLSKGWKLIERFSEDVDIVIDRAALGFGGSDSPEKAPSQKQTRKRLDALREAAQKAIAESISPALEQAIRAELPDGDWQLIEDEDDPDGQTLLFAYPTAFPDHPEYLRQVVKIEMGARSDTDPSEQVEISPIIAETFPELMPGSAFPVRCVDPVRTFWEKAMLLHEETYRPPDRRKQKTGLARHYYDLYRLIQGGYGEKAAQDLSLFERIAAHRRVYFRYGWLDYATLSPGRLRIVPLEDQMAAWRQDYRNMQSEMFYGEVPAFEEIIETVREFQDSFNTCHDDSII